VKHFRTQEDTALRTLRLTLARLHSLDGSPASRYIKRAKKIAVATLLQPEQIACFRSRYARAAASFLTLSGDQ
jgi:hypothetical protein